METIYLILIVFLFLLAIFDLVVGVSNDAVNFLNSAIGSKAAGFKTILAIAGLGVLIGAGLSNGMMDVVRHGIFQPQNFYFKEIIFILLAAMLTDIILLDIFNSLGLPTSTTVSMVFELLGATFAFSLLKISEDPTLNMSELINSGKALSVIIAIFSSVAIAFVFGTLAQYLARIAFTFNYKKQMKYFAAVFGGAALTAIVYFMLIKGLKHSSFMNENMSIWIKENTVKMMVSCFIGFTILMQLLYFFKINILKIIVLSGTFALALAFAGNDLVNFIGMPLAGLSAFETYIDNGGGNIDATLKMSSLLESSNTSIWFLIGAGVIMVIALFTSKKAHNVIKTSIDLSRQGDGEEAFSSSLLARNIVRYSYRIASWIEFVVPRRMRIWIDSRFRKSNAEIEENASFDLVRASINLIMASVLIAFGTSFKLPLSTTYVAFMVAMGSSLADRAWGRESAVFRISGVLNVIGGWFLTAGVAFLLAFVIALLIVWGEIISIAILVIVTAFILVQSQKKYNNKKNKESQENQTMSQLMRTENETQALDLLRKFSKDDIESIINYTTENYNKIMECFSAENLRHLRRLETGINEYKNDLKKSKRTAALAIRKLSSTDAYEKGFYFDKCNDFSSELIYSLGRICTQCKEHIDNNFTMPDKYQKNELETLSFEVATFVDKCRKIISDDQYENYKDMANRAMELVADINEKKRRQLKRIQERNDSTKMSMVYLGILQESQNIVSYATNLMKVSRKFQKK